MLNLTENTFKVFKTVLRTIGIRINISKLEIGRSENDLNQSNLRELPNIYQNCQYHLIYNHYSLLYKFQACDFNTYESVSL